MIKEIILFLFNSRSDRNPRIIKKTINLGSCHCRCCGKIMDEPVFYLGEYWDKPHLVLYMIENKEVINGEK